MKKLDLDKKEKFLKSLEVNRTNKSDSKNAFFQEKNFYTKAYEEKNDISKQFANINYDNMHLGRVDRTGISVKPKKQFLIQVRNAENSVFALNFAAKAYDDFMSFWDYLKRHDSLDKQSVIYDLKLYSAFKDLDKEYEKLYQVYFTKFLNFVNVRKFSSSISDFKSFFDVFSIFADSQMPLLPITKTFYNISKFFDVKGSGLIFEFSEKNQIKDSIVYEKWIKDPNFQIYKNSVEQFGFTIDKSAPWRIIANINSIPMVEYMQSFNVTPDNLYSLMYEPVSLNDIKALQERMFSLYYSFVVKEPYFTKLDNKTCNNNLKIKANLVYRDTNPSITDVSKEKWIRLYVFLRAREINIDWTQSKFDIFVKNTIELEKSLDTSAAMSYIERFLNIKTKSTRKNNNFSL